ncbi:MAG TPA: DUF3373 domain-containing protein [Desulfobulbaceae bacterium]|nr:DUF3373 domain-containing protein [Desulfobulbaceae bacterium]
MMKKFSLLALAGLIALPGIASASAGKMPSDLAQRVDELSRQLDELKAQLAKQNEELAAVGNQVDDMGEEFDAKSEAWDLASRVQLYGDFRTRLDMMTSETARQYSVWDVANGFNAAMGQQFGFSGPYSREMVRMAVNGFKMYTPQQRAGLFQMMGYAPLASDDVDNDTMMTNRLRLNMRVPVTENVDFKGRLAMYKAWGMESNPAAPMGSPFTLDSFNWDGNSTRQPVDNVVRVDRAFVNWNNIAGKPIWFSFGRRPTTDGPPAHIRLNNDERMATPIAYMDYPFDGATLGIAYDWGSETLGVGRLRFCGGRGFEDGLSTNQLNDMDFFGIDWDILQRGPRLLNLQAFEAFNLVNTPDGINFPNPLELSGITAGNGILDKSNLGNLYHTTLIYMDKVSNFNYFLVGGWSRTDPEGYDEAGNSLLGSWWAPLDSQDGFALYAGIRYDIDDLRLKLGLEYNWGSEYWISMSPGHDDLYNSKLATRGQVAEVYMLYDLPTGEAISKYAKTFMRLGYQYYKYDYSYSGSWLGGPVDVDELASDPFNAQFYPALDDMSQIYLSFDIYF